jgi:signal transduction histidine kinase
VGTWLHRVHPDDQLVVRDLLVEILTAPHQQTFEMEYRFKRDDGEYAYIYDRCIILKDEKNKPFRLIGAAQDISDRKRLERELIKAELDYQRLINQATVDSQEKERAEIGKELHDNINQVLTTTKLYLDLALTEPSLKENLIQKSLTNINNVIQEIRLLSRSLMDPSVGDLGLIASINDLIENIHLTQKLFIVLRADDCLEEKLDANQKLAIFRIIQESLSNVLRHAKADQVIIEMRAALNELKLTIKDNGMGFSSETLKKGAGLKNIQNRIYLIGGTLQLLSKPGGGCSLHLQCPIKTYD